MLPDYSAELFPDPNERSLIYDPVRKRWLKATPEEVVRQRLIRYLVQTHGYPLGRIAVERSIKYLGRVRRFDLLVFDKYGQPFLLAECKAPTVKIDASAVFQAGAYLSVLPGTYLILTNGQTLLCFDPKKSLIATIPPPR